MRILLVITVICAISAKNIEPPIEQQLPIQAPDKCPGNRLLYHLPNTNQWICDCAPGYLYYQSKNDCYAIYRQGPCPTGQHLVLNKRKVECVTNPCQNGFARYKGKCYELEKPDGPCPPVHQGGGIFKVNVTTLNVECVQGSELLSIFKTQPICPPGSQRDQQNICRENYNV